MKILTFTLPLGFLPNSKSIFQLNQRFKPNPETIFVMRTINLGSKKSLRIWVQSLVAELCRVGKNKKITIDLQPLDTTDF